MFEIKVCNKMCLFSVFSVRILVTGTTAHSLLITPVNDLQRQNSLELTKDGAGSEDSQW